MEANISLPARYYKVQLIIIPRTLGGLDSWPYGNPTICILRLIREGKENDSFLLRPWYTVPEDERFFTVRGITAYTLKRRENQSFTDQLDVVYEACFMLSVPIGTDTVLWYALCVPIQELKGNVFFEERNKQLGL